MGLKSSIENMPKWSINLILVVLIFIASIILFQVNIKFAERTAIGYMAPLEISDSLATHHVKTTNVLNGKQLEVLSEQMEFITNRKAHHKTIFLDLYKYYYGTITTFHLLTVIAGILTFLIANNGWKSANPLLRTVFLTIVGLSTYFGLFPVIFDQQTTIDKNEQLYISYTNLGYEVYNYAVSDSGITTNGDTVDYNIFIKNINKELIKYNEIYFGLDHQAIETKDYFELINAPGANPTAPSE